MRYYSIALLLCLLVCHFTNLFGQNRSEATADLNSNVPSDFNSVSIGYGHVISGIDPSVPVNYQDYVKGLLNGLALKVDRIYYLKKYLSIGADYSLLRTRTSQAPISESATINTLMFRLGIRLLYEDKNAIAINAGAGAAIAIRGASNETGSGIFWNQDYCFGGGIQYHRFADWKDKYGYSIGLDFIATSFNGYQNISPYAGTTFIDIQENWPSLRFAAGLLIY